MIESIENLEDLKVGGPESSARSRSGSGFSRFS